MKTKTARVVNIITLLALAAGAMLAVPAALDILRDIGEYAEAYNEYAQLRDIRSASAAETDSNAAYMVAAGQPAGAGRAANAASPMSDFFVPMSEFSDINPDFQGWLSIEGTEVDYPVARGIDNAEYMKKTFRGKNNAAGAIFMDYRCVDGFCGPVSVIYGHNMKDGTMFASLKRCLDPDFIASRPVVTVATANGEWLEYTIFGARQTDAWDEIYSLEYGNMPCDENILKSSGDENITTSPCDENIVTSHYDVLFNTVQAPYGAKRILILSTCVGGANGDARLLVFASA